MVRPGGVMEGVYSRLTVHMACKGVQRRAKACRGVQRRAKACRGVGSTETHVRRGSPAILGSPTSLNRREVAMASLGIDPAAALS